MEDKKIKKIEIISVGIFIILILICAIFFYIFGIEDLMLSKLSKEELDYYEFSFKEIHRKEDSESGSLTYLIDVNESDRPLYIRDIMTDDLDVQRNIQGLLKNEKIYCYVVADSNRLEVLEIANDKMIFSLEECQVKLFDDGIILMIFGGVFSVMFFVSVGILIHRIKKNKNLSI